MRNPRQTFEDNIRPAELLLRVYRLLDTNDGLLTEGKMVDELRKVVGANNSEDLMLVYNEVFMGLVREGAQMPRSTLKRVSLAHLLRQAVVASCTSLETYLPAILHAKLPVVLKAMGRGFINFIPRDDKIFTEKFKTMTFSLDEVLRLLVDPNATDYIASKLISFLDFSYLSGSKGVYVVGKLVGIPQPIPQIAEKLNRDPVDLERILNDTVTRRNDIVHRADRSQKQSDDEPQNITYAWALQSTDGIRQVCVALDELIAERAVEFEAVIQENSEK